MSNSKIMFVLLGGAAVGVALGVLFAPDKGSKMRKNLSNSAKEFADKILSKAEELVDESGSLNKRPKEKAAH